MDSAVNHLKVSVQQRADKAGEFMPVTQYRFFLGDNGPFTLEYAAGKDTQAQVESDIAALCTKLRAVGALAATGY